jgi:hypothetical protein
MFNNSHRTEDMKDRGHGDGGYTGAKPEGRWFAFNV